MRNLDIFIKSIDKILIPSGPSEKIDLQRAKGAIDAFGNDNYTILGVGPDIYKALKYFKGGEEIPKGLDHHISLYNYVINDVGKEKVELITQSTTAVQNLLEFFKNQREGTHTIVADSWLLSKYKYIFNVLRKKRKVSDNADLTYCVIETDEYYWGLRKIASRLKTELGLRKIR